MCAVALRLAVLLLAMLACAAAQEQPTPVFGTTVVIPSGLRGLVYYLHPNHLNPNASKLPNFKKMKPAGPAIYTSSLNLPPQDFRRGFPGVTDRIEWFAIDYAGKFWITDPGTYTFSVLSDDGAKLYIDDELVIDNDGVHPPIEKMSDVELAGGLHRIRVSYFQGPKFQVALVLKVAGLGQDLRVFSTDEFKPPPDPGQWRFPKGSDAPKAPDAPQ
jgi:PA14 domain